MEAVTPRKVARVSLEVTYDDGTVMTFAADDPRRVELDIGARPVPPILVAPELFTIEPPHVHRASVSFEASLQSPARVGIRQALTAAGPDDREFLVQLLRVVADDLELDPSEVEFAVVTAGRKEHGAITYWPWEKGEIVAVPVDGYRDLREGRGFHKYGIGEERFGRDYAAAKRRSDEVKSRRDVDMFARRP